jgi:hypothetical protein
MPNALFGVAKKTRHDGLDLPAWIETVAGMPRLVAFCIDFPTSGAIATKTVCYR